MTIYIIWEGHVRLCVQENVKVQKTIEFFHLNVSWPIHKNTTVNRKVPFKRVMTYLAKQRFHLNMLWRIQKNIEILRCSEVSFETGMTYQAVWTYYNLKKALFETYCDAFTKCADQIKCSFEPRVKYQGNCGSRKTCWKVSFKQVVTYPAKCPDTCWKVSFYALWRDKQSEYPTSCKHTVTGRTAVVS